MKLTVKNREGAKKSEAKKIRRESNVPAILYAAGHANELIVVDGTEFATVIRGMKPGHLSTTIFTLKSGNKERRAVIKDIQYKRTTYQVSHIDFQELIDGVPITVKVPIICTGIAECAGIKLGGMLRQVIRTIKVECDPKKIPDEFVVDIRELGIRQKKRLSDLEIPKGVRPLADLNEVVVTISKQRAS